MLATSMTATAAGKQVIELCREERVDDAFALFMEHPGLLGPAALIAALSRWCNLDRAFAVFCALFGDSRSHTAAQPNDSHMVAPVAISALVGSLVSWASLSMRSALLAMLISWAWCPAKRAFGSCCWLAWTPVATTLQQLLLLSACLSGRGRADLDSSSTRRTALSW